MIGPTSSTRESLCGADGRAFAGGLAPTSAPSARAGHAIREAPTRAHAYAPAVARGENEQAPDRSVGIAIFVVFLVVCAMVAYVVARAVVPDEPPIAVGSRHDDWRSILSAVRGRSCSPPSGLAVGATDPATALERELTTRGYAPTGTAWSEPLGFPVTLRPEGLGGACGVVALLTQGGVVTAIGTDPTALVPPCRGELTTFAVCGDETPIVAQGWGEVRVRTFALPGLDSAAATATELPIEALLSHVEAESMLARSGWRASPTVWRQEQRAGSVPVLPPAPATDCEPWVVVGLGVENATSTFDGTLIGNELGPRRFVIGVVRCAGSLGGELSYDSSRDGTLYWRRFAPGATPPRIEAPALGALPRVVDDVAQMVAP